MNTESLPRIVDTSEIANIFKIVSWGQYDLETLNAKAALECLNSAYIFIYDDYKINGDITRVAFVLHKGFPQYSRQCLWDDNVHAWKIYEPRIKNSSQARLSDREVKNIVNEIYHRRSGPQISTKVEIMKTTAEERVVLYHNYSLENGSETTELLFVLYNEPGAFEIFLWDSCDSAWKFVSPEKF